MLRYLERFRRIGPPWEDILLLIANGSL